MTFIASFFKERRAMNKILAAHIRDDGTVQTILEHLLGTANLSKKFGQVFGGGEHAYLCGLLHDIGKYSEKFQKRIYQGGNKVDHSTAGAVEINKAVAQIGFLLSYCIAGHHTGLPDGGSFADSADEPTLNGRLKRVLESYEHYRRDINLELFSIKPLLPIRPLGKAGFSVSFYIRMLFSCLVDSDFLDTEGFMEGDKGRGSFSLIDDLNHGEL
jgi:CRISPR-associated endonuclease/helicase Cas3